MRGSGNAGSVATLKIVKCFQAAELPLSPTVGVGIGTGVGAIGARPATWLKT